MANIQRIIFLVENPFDSRDYKRRGIEILKANNFNVEVWDTTPLIFPYLYKKDLYPPFKFKGLRVFLSKEELRKEIYSLDHSSFIISLLFFHAGDIWIFKAISKSKVEYAVVSANTFPSFENKKLLLSFYIKKLFPPTPSKIISILLRRLPLKLLGIKTAKFIFAGSPVALRSTKFPINKNTEIVWTHDLDYDLYLEVEKKNATQAFNNKDYIVFIDQYLPFHIDLKISGLNKYIDPDDYYNSLERFFDFLAKKTGMQIIIAAHPRSEYEKKERYFKNYTIIKHKTIELIKNSRLVLLHNSTARNFAILYKKPMLFLTSSKIDKTFHGELIRMLAEYFKMSPIYINKFTEDLSLNKIFLVDETLYLRYKENYIKTAVSPNLPFWQIVSDRLKRL